MAAQGSLIRSPTTFWTEDGNFFGFEGSLGASTSMWNGDFGGSCPLNCTHVWNYEMALSRLFPRPGAADAGRPSSRWCRRRKATSRTARSSRSTSVSSGTNRSAARSQPALDGMLGAVLKTYREVAPGRRPRLAARPLGKRPPADRVHPRQRGTTTATACSKASRATPTTSTSSARTSSSAALWLAALRAGEELARLVGEPAYAADAAGALRRWQRPLRRAALERRVLHPAPGRAARRSRTSSATAASPISSSASGGRTCSDLGYILPRGARARPPCDSIVRYNTREGFGDFEHGFRVYADRDDSGLLICTWPQGRPPGGARPLLRRGLDRDRVPGRRPLHHRGAGRRGDARSCATCAPATTGERRNPYNEIECGDHYARAMAGWSVLEAISGLRYDATRHEFILSRASGRSGSRLPLIAATGWGAIAQDEGAEGLRLEIRADHGTILLRRLIVDEHDGGPVAVDLDGRPLASASEHADRRQSIRFSPDLRLSAGQRLTVRIGRQA